MGFFCDHVSETNSLNVRVLELLSALSRAQEELRTTANIYQINIMKHIIVTIGKKFLVKAVT